MEFPYKGWVLQQSFKPVEIEIEKESRYSAGYHESTKGKCYHVGDIFQTKDDAIKNGYERLDKQQQDLDKKQSNINKRRSSLDKACAAAK